MTKRSARHDPWRMPDRVDAIILCGGAGTRLRSVSGGVPKSLMTVSDRPFLQLLLAQLQRHGFHRVILATGYGAEAIRCQLGGRFSTLELVYSCEQFPLGTGGALRHAAKAVQTPNCLVMNGDSYTDVDLGQFAKEHVETQAQASLVVVPADERCDSGSIAIDNSGNLIEFLEKQGHGAGRYVNAGVYALQSSILFEIPDDIPVSLEKQLLPGWIHAGLTLRAFLHCGKCVDIGTPERYQSAQSFLANAERENVRSN